MYDADHIRGRIEQLCADAAFQDSVHRIRPGKFRRTPESSDYAARLTYTTALREFVYNPAALNLILSNAALKAQFFRAFGYTGSLDFTIYPNCWLRDLPLLNIGEKAYLADGIVLGTNQVSTDQRFVTADVIRIGARTIFDQDCMIGYGTSIGADCVVGIRCAVGIKSAIGEGTSIGEMANIGHGCHIGSAVRIGQVCVIGNFSMIEEGVALPDQARLPSFSRVSSAGIFHRRTGERIAAL